VDTLNDNVKLAVQRYRSAHRWIALVKRENTAVVFENTGWNTTLLEAKTRDESLEEIGDSFPQVLARACASVD
jgi:hypothetical protein